MNERATVLLDKVSDLLVALAAELDQDYECVDIKLLVDLACPIGEGLGTLTH